MMAAGGELPAIHQGVIAGPLPSAHALGRDGQRNGGSDERNCKPFANGSDVTGLHRTGLDETATRRFVDRSPLDRTDWVWMDGSRVSSSPPSDTNAGTRLVLGSSARGLPSYADVLH